MRSFTFCRLSLTQYYSSDQIKKNEMGMACGMYGERSADTVIVGNMREEDHLEDLGVDGKTTLKWFFKKYDAGREMD